MVHTSMPLSCHNRVRVRLVRSWDGCLNAVSVNSKPQMRSMLSNEDMKLEHLQEIVGRLGFNDLQEGELKRLYEALL